MGCSSSVAVDESTMGVHWFSRERVIGKGGFGKVNAVRKIVGEDASQWYAMKTMSKVITVKKGNHALEQLYNELEILKNLSEHAQIVKLHYAFQDSTNCYMVMDLSLGGDLRYHLRDNNKKANPCVVKPDGKRWFPEEIVRFCAAQVLLALKELHSRHILHRDIKPENVVLDEAGFLKLIDFGIAKSVAKGPCLYSSGTPLYQAPEIAMKGHKHSYASDFYSLGVMLIELVSGVHPFWHINSDNSTEMFKAKKNFLFQKFSKNGGLDGASDECKSVIEGLMIFKEEDRLGYNGVDEIMQHAWFKDIAWDQFDRKANAEGEAPTCVAPFIPDVKTANFSSGNEDLMESFFPKTRKEIEEEEAIIKPSQKDFTDFNFNRYAFEPASPKARRLSKVDSKKGPNLPKAFGLTPD